MPWKECSVMDERLRFVAKLLDGESMTEVCREFGISLKTGYKVFQRYMESGFDAWNDLYPWSICFLGAQFEGVTHVSGTFCQPWDLG